MLKQISLSLASIGLIGLASTSTLAIADEGQWQPHQLLKLKAELKRTGIQIPAEKLADLTKHPMSAMVSLGGCSASFVSPSGLIVTNHHCAYGAIQRNSTAENNLIANGFLAKTMAQELPAGSNSLVYITEKVEDVTKQVLQGLSADLSGAQRNQKIQQKIKSLIAECEQDKAYRCSIPSFHRGMEYYLIRQMMIRDVRLVYAPSNSVGDYGGDIDNFEWPRHTGDYSFLRAYVGKDGRPADPSPENVPYQSKDFLVVSAQGLKNGDPILLAGYPGVTSRYKLPVEVRNARDTDYPMRVAEMVADLDTIASATKGDASSQVRYAAVVKSINNRLKKAQGLIAGFARKDIAAIKDLQDAQFRTWLQKNSSTQDQAVMAQLDKVIADDISLSQEEFAFAIAIKSDLLSNARTLYRLALETQKPNAERESGFQERDLAAIKARLTNLEKSFVLPVDIARYRAALQRYTQLPSQFQSASLQTVLPNGEAVNALFQGTELAKTEARLAWIGKPVSAFTSSNDSMIQLAVKMYDIGMNLEKRRKEVDGQLERVIPEYMKAVIAWKNSQGKPVYPDANSTLRVTFGKVAPYSPRDGVTKGPFTTVQGIVEKHTGKEPFNAPSNLLQAIAEQRYGVFKDPILGTVPVNFLSSADTTGGNSGSAIMNAKGELIGLNFDSTYESVTKDFYYDTEITRAIHMDIRYMLWLMKEIDGADNLLKEMTIKYPK